VVFTENLSKIISFSPEKTSKFTGSKSEIEKNGFDIEKLYYGPKFQKDRIYGSNYFFALIGQTRFPGQ
jgi:hypothetical protein